MVLELSGGDLYFLVRELGFLVDSKIEKIYQLDKQKLVFRLFNQGVKKNFVVVVPGSVCFSDKEFSAPVNPPGFCMSLRKHIGKGRIVGVKQHDLERILVLDVVCKGKNYSLIFELFKPGNVVLVCDDKIVNCVDRQTFKDREVKHHQVYVFPPSQVNVLSLSEEQFFDVFSESDKSLVKCLALDFSLGGVYAEEILFRASLDKDSLEKNEEVSKKLFFHIKDFFGQSINAWRDPKKAYPVDMLSLNLEEKLLCKSFNDAVSFFLELEKRVEVKKVKEKKSLSDIQSKRIKELESESAECQKVGEFIYSNYQDFSLLLEKINVLKKKMSLDEVEKELKKNKHFKSMNKKDKTITLEF